MTHVVYRLRCWFVNQTFRQIYYGDIVFIIGQTECVDMYIERYIFINFINLPWFADYSN